MLSNGLRAAQRLSPKYAPPTSHCSRASYRVCCARAYRLRHRSNCWRMHHRMTTREPRACRASCTHWHVTSPRAWAFRRRLPVTRRSSARCTASWSRSARRRARCRPSLHGSPTTASAPPPSARKCAPRSPTPSRSCCSRSPSQPRCSCGSSRRSSRSSTASARSCRRRRNSYSRCPPRLDAGACRSPRSRACSYSRCVACCGARKWLVCNSPARRCVCPSPVRCSRRCARRAGAARSARCCRPERRSPMHSIRSRTQRATPGSIARPSRSQRSLDVACGSRPRCVKPQCFPEEIVQPVAIAEESGTLDTMLLDVASLSDRQVDEKIAGLASLCEPLVIVVLGGLVGGLVVAMYLPIIQLGNVV